MVNADIGVVSGLMAVAFVILLNVGPREGNWKLWVLLLVLLAARGLYWLLARGRERRLLAEDGSGDPSVRGGGLSSTRGMSNDQVEDRCRGAVPGSACPCRTSADELRGCSQRLVHSVRGWRRDMDGGDDRDPIPMNKPHSIDGPSHDMELCLLPSRL